MSDTPSPLMLRPPPADRKGCATGPTADPRISADTGMPAAMGSYSSKVSLDGTEVQRVPFRVIQPPQQQIGFGPTAIPGGPRR